MPREVQPSQSGRDWATLRREQNALIRMIEQDGTIGERVWLPLLRLVRWWAGRR